jgi:uncharacterized membrane protein YfcA
MLIVESLAFYLVAVPAVLLVGVGKGGFAGGFGMLAVPLLAFTVSPLQAAAIMLPILCVMDLTGVKIWLHRWDHALMAKLLPGAVLGIVVGALTFRFVDDTFMRLLIGLMALVFPLNHWLGRWLKPGQRSLRLPEYASATLWSGLSGYTSFVAHAGSPPIMIYLLPKKLDKGVFVGTVTIYFAVVNYVKLIPYALLGQLDTENLLTSLILAPAAVVGVKLGVWLHDRVDGRVFTQLMYVFLFLAGMKLTWDGMVKVLA